jgi:Flp pilus assembly protein CpaB
MVLGTGGSSRHESRWSELTTRLALRRRLVAAALAGVAVICTVSALRPAAAPTGTVWVAARDLSGGGPLAAADVTVERLPTVDVPNGAVGGEAALVGRMLAAPMRRGEPFTDVRLLSPSLLAASDLAGTVAVPVRVADGPAALALVHAGDTVDVIAVADSAVGGPAISTTVVHDVRVLATPARSAGSGDGSDASAGLLIVAADKHQAAALARATATSQLSVAVQRPS